MLVPYIDWTFFFAAWELKGTFPAILEHRSTAPAARELYDNARLLLDRIVREKLLTASGVYGFWPAASEDDDIVVYRDADAAGELTRFNMLRQQEALASGQSNLSLADFIAPRGGPADYIGAFAVTAGLGADELARRFEREHDDYSAILVKALADRLAEAFAAYPAPPRAQGLGHRRAAHRRRRFATSRTAASVRRSAIPRAPITARSSSCSTLLGAERSRHRAHRARGDDCRRRASAACTSRTRRRGTSRSAASARIRSRATRGEKGSRSIRSSAG